MTDIRLHIERLLKALSRGAYEREEAIGLSLLAALSGESIFLLGLPGVGKSMIARRLKMAFSDATSFEYLMSRFSTPDEIFGPVSISKLKDEDTYERVVEGYLPTADIVFLDEIWKAGPAIQNSLLTAINERIYHNGNHDLRLPLKTIISASNELPAEGEGLEALWDRFLIRYVVDPISDRKAFISLLTEKEKECVIDKKLAFTDKDLKRIKSQSAEISIPPVICNIICEIRDVLRDVNMAGNYFSDEETTPYVSDRRWRKIMGILKTSAFLNGRNNVDPSDCILMQHLLWDKDTQREDVRCLIADMIARRFQLDVSDMSEIRLSKPVGKPLSPDEKHYIVIVGDEEIFIGIEDYKLLKGNPAYAEIDDSNHLHVNSKSGSFTISINEDGNIILNSFCYQLKRDSPLRSGTSDSLINAFNSNNRPYLSEIKSQIDNNLFMGKSTEFPEISRAFSNLGIRK